MAISFDITWFGILLEIILLVFAVFISYTSYRMYVRFEKPKYLQFSRGFTFISIGYFFSAVVSILPFVSASILSSDSQSKLIMISTIAWYVSALVGLLLLTYLYYDVPRWRLRLLLASLVFVAFIFGQASDFAFFIISGLLFFFIALKLFHYYRMSSEQSSLFVLAGFALLFVAKLFSGALFIHGGLYVGYYLFKLAGVSIIAYELWVISR